MVGKSWIHIGKSKRNTIFFDVPELFSPTVLCLQPHQLPYRSNFIDKHDIVKELVRENEDFSNTAAMDHQLCHQYMEFFPGKLRSGQIYSFIQLNTLHS